MLPQATLDQAAALLAEVQGRGLTLATAESCTGGLVAAALTAIPGSSASVLGGLVTYSNDQKMALLGVPEAVLASVGAVSEDCARNMAEGARMATGADIAVSTTGIAGPGGATVDKPVGLVFIAAARQGQATRVQRFVFPGDRAAVRAATVAAALDAIQAIARA